jgi:hypothetical protein
MHFVASAEVSEVTRKITDMNTTGGLRDFNKRYKAYRQAKAAAGERAMSYSAYLSTLTKKMVEEVARLAGLKGVHRGSAVGRKVQPPQHEIAMAAGWRPARRMPPRPCKLS